jgi:proteasome-associated ATPase
MRNTTQRDASQLFQLLLSSSTGARGDVDAGIEMLQQFRGQSAEGSALVDRLLVQEIGQCRAGLAEAQAAQQELRHLIEQFTAPPYFSAVFLGQFDNGPQAMAVVRSGGEVRAVGLGSLETGSLQPGDGVLLSRERNFVLCKSAQGPHTCGETAAFVRHADGGRLVVRSREEELVVLAAAPLRDSTLKAGDLVRFDRTECVAYEKLDRPRGEAYFLEESPAESFEGLGGLDRQIEEIKHCIELHFYHPEEVRAYRLRRKKAILLYGPPGTGKTLVARCLANWMGGLSKGGRSRFINIKPSSLHSMWYGQSQANYREVFRIAREAGEADPDIPVVMFFDEIDSTGGARGNSIHHIDDAVLNSFMAELNGLEERGNILVIAATNRLDALDSALIRPGRLGDLVLRIPRPNRTAARQIFGKHLPQEIPYASNGHSPVETRRELIDTAVSLIYTGNGDAEVAEIMFRDGKRRAVHASELINGAEIAAIAQAAIEQACRRSARGGARGVEMKDLRDAVAGFLDSAARALTPANCRSYLDELPQDVDVVRVEPVVRKTGPLHHYVNAA